MKSPNVHPDVHIGELYSENSTAAFHGDDIYIYIFIYLFIYLFMFDPTTYLSSRLC
jgi:hypothetical protein